jgi:hypothetical protein
VFAGISDSALPPASFDPLLNKEVLFSVSEGNRKVAFYSGFVL